MSLDDFKFAFEENEEGFTVTLKGDKEKLRARLEAFEAFLNFKEKVTKAGFEHHQGSDSPIHQFFKAMHKHHGHHGGGHGHCGHHGHHAHHAHHGENPFKHGHCGAPSPAEPQATQSEQTNKADE